MQFAVSTLILCSRDLCRLQTKVFSLSGVPVMLNFCGPAAVHYGDNIAAIKLTTLRLLLPPSFEQEEEEEETAFNLQRGFF